MLEIEAESARDDTATGQRYALQARAACPTAEAKAEAWASVVDGESLANRTVASVIAGFQAVPADKREELLQPYVARYFGAVEAAWDSRTHEIAAQIATGLYPALVIDQATLNATDTWLADRQPVPALRRLVVENADAVVRCLRGQARDRAAGS